jgi:hypothetical protein
MAMIGVCSKTKNICKRTRYEQKEAGDSAASGAEFYLNLGVK